jgi:hypothetical protein
VTGLLVYNSVYFKKLDAPKSEVESNKTVPAAFARLFWDRTFSKAIDSAITMEVFEKEFIDKGAQNTINKYSHSQGVSGIAYMLQKPIAGVASLHSILIIILEMGLEMLQV